ncbi:MAG: CPBP family intramembrane glutamic endopeptidase [Rhizomicrobium sp.]
MSTFRAFFAGTPAFAPDPASGWRPWGLLVPFLCIAFVAATVVSLQVVLQHHHLLDAQENPIGIAGFAAFLLGPFSALGLTVLAWVRFVERRPFGTMGLVRGRAREFFLGHLMGVAMMTAIVLGICAAGAYQAGAIGVAFGSAAGLAGIAVLLAGFAIQSSVEELVFRGWMFSAISAKLGIPSGIVLSTLVFVLLHFDPDATAFFYANVVLFAVFACLFALGRGNVWGVMGWHAGWNWIAATGFEIRVTGLDAHMPALVVRMVPGGADILTGGHEGPEGSIVCTLVLLVATAAAGWCVRARGPGSKRG